MEIYRKLWKEQKEWLDNILPDPHPCTAGNKEEEHTIVRRGAPTTTHGFWIREVSLQSNKLRSVDMPSDVCVYRVS